MARRRVGGLVTARSIRLVAATVTLVAGTALFATLFATQAAAQGALQCTVSGGTLSWSGTPSWATAQDVQRGGVTIKHLGRNARSWTDPSPTGAGYAIVAKNGSQTQTVSCGQAAPPSTPPPSGPVFACLASGGDVSWSGTPDWATAQDVLRGGTAVKFLGRTARSWTDPSPTGAGYAIVAKNGAQQQTVSCAVSSGGPIDLSGAFLPASIVSPKDGSAPLDASVANVFKIASGAVDADATLHWRITNQRTGKTHTTSTGVSSWLIVPAGKLAANSRFTWQVEAEGKCWQDWCQQAFSTTESFRTAAAATPASASFTLLQPVHAGGLKLSGAYTNDSGQNAEIRVRAVRGSLVRSQTITLPTGPVGTGSRLWSREMGGLAVGDWRVCAELVTQSPPSTTSLGCRGQYVNALMRWSDLRVTEVSSGIGDEQPPGAVIDWLPNIEVEGPHSLLSLAVVFRDDDRFRYPTRGQVLEVRVDGSLVETFQAPQVRATNGYTSTARGSVLIRGAGQHRLCLSGVPTRPDGLWEPKLDLGCRTVTVAETPPEQPQGRYCTDVNVQAGPWTTDSRVKFPVDTALEARNGKWEFCATVDRFGTTFTYQRAEGTWDTEVPTSVSIVAKNHNGSAVSRRSVCSWASAVLPDCDGNVAPNPADPYVPITLLQTASRSMQGTVLIVICSVRADSWPTDEYCFYPVSVKIYD